MGNRFVLVRSFGCCKKGLPAFQGMVAQFLQEIFQRFLGERAGNGCCLVWIIKGNCANVCKVAFYYRINFTGIPWNGLAHSDFEIDAIAVEDSSVGTFPDTDFNGFVTLFSFGVVKFVGGIFLWDEGYAHILQARNHALGGGFGIGECGLSIVSFQEVKFKVERI